MKICFAVALLVAATACNQSGGDAPSAPAAPAVPHRCEVCNGTGSITQSAEAPLAAHIVQCDLAATGFLGLGADRVATVGVQNDGDEGGSFTLQVFGDYPGGGRVLNGTGHVYIGPHQTGTERVQFTPQPGMQNITCHTEAPSVVQHHTVVCPRCNGAGMVQ
jgi:hypothetical protein